MGIFYAKSVDFVLKKVLRVDLLKRSCVQGPTESTICYQNKMERIKDFLTKNTLSAIKLAGFLHCFSLKVRFLEVRCFSLEI